VSPIVEEDLYYEAQAQIAVCDREMGSSAARIGNFKRSHTAPCEGIRIGGAQACDVCLADGRNEAGGLEPEIFRFPLPANCRKSLFCQTFVLQSKDEDCPLEQSVGRCRGWSVCDIDLLCAASPASVRCSVSNDFLRVAHPTGFEPVASAFGGITTSSVDYRKGHAMMRYVTVNKKEFDFLRRQAYPSVRHGFRPAAYVVLTRVFGHVTEEVHG